MSHPRTALFLTCPPGLGLQVVTTVRERWPEDDLVVFVRESERGSYGEALAGVEVRADKPTGGRLRFLHGLRKERFKRAVVVWGGHRDRWHMKVAAALCRPGELHAYNENMGGFEVTASSPIVASHIRWRLQTSGTLLPRSVWRALYACTIGFVLGHAWLLLSWMWWQTRYRLHRPRGA